jgi:EmrB/QacA subfamily drug resistance transporter
MTRRELLTLIATILGSTIVFLDSTVVSVALPAIERDLDTGLAGQQWVVEAYLLTLVALMLVGGSLGDLYGRRRLFTAGLAGFGVTSVLCAVAPSDEFLIGARGLQGIAGALLVPGSLAILAATFEGEARGRAVGLWTAWSGISTLAGPAGGGFLVDELSWRWIFWINLPLVVATLLLTRYAVEESKDPEACPGIDWGGIALSAIGIGGPVFALVEQPANGWGAPQVAVPLVAGVVAIAGFVLHEGRARAPMLPLSLFRSRNFSVTNAATLCVYGGLIGGSFFITIFLQGIAGYSAFEAGLATTPITVLLFLLSGRFGALAGRIGPRALMGAGPIVAGAGMALLLRVDESGDYLTDVLPALIPFGIGLAMTVAPLTVTVLDSVDERHAGIASGTNNAVSRVAGMLAIAALGAVIAGQFDSAVSGRVAEDAGLSPAARSAIDASRESPLTPNDLAEVPAGERAAVEAEIDEAATSGFRLGIGLAAALMVIGGVISAIGIRNPRRPVEAEDEHVPRAATAGECGRVAERPSPPSPVPGTLVPEPAATGAPDPSL